MNRPHVDSPSLGDQDGSAHWERYGAKAEHGMNFMVNLFDNNQANGNALWVLPRSHRRGPLPRPCATISMPQYRCHIIDRREALNDLNALNTRQCASSTGRPPSQSLCPPPAPARAERAERLHWPAARHCPLLCCAEPGDVTLVSRHCAGRLPSPSPLSSTPVCTSSCKPISGPVHTGAATILIIIK